MAKSIPWAVSFVALLANTAFANESLKEGRSASCSNMTLVCAIMKDGSVKPTSECDAQQEGVARVLAGDCYDED